jgi:HSP20 family protein
MRTTDLRQLQQEFDRAFREARAWVASPAAGPSFEPPTDVIRASQTDFAYLVRMDLPGVSREQVRIYAEEGALSISGTKELPVREGGKVLRAERSHGRFSRVVALPSDADFNTVSATLHDGVLTVRVDRRRPTSRGPIEITVG